MRPGVRLPFGWVVLDQREVRAISERLASPGSGGTVDDLGLGTITDPIADTLFPAFTTLMSRARYFLFGCAVIEVAAQEARGRVIEETRSEDLHEHNAALPVRFSQLFDRSIEDVEISLCMALRLGAPTETGIIGSDNIQKWLNVRSLPKFGSKLFGLLARYPSGIYMGGMRKLGAFAAGINSRSAIAQSYCGALWGQQEAVWSPSWRAALAPTISEVREIYRGYFGARKSSTELAWRAKFRKGPLKVRPGKLDAKFLLQQFSSCKPKRKMTLESAEAAIPGAVAAVFVECEEDIRANAEGYEILAKRCKLRAAKDALRAAAAVMVVGGYCKSVYEAVLNELVLRGSRRPADEEFAKLMKSFASNRQAAQKAVLRLEKWSPQGGWRDGRRTLVWLQRWLKVTDAKKSFFMLQRREYDVVKRRGKNPRLGWNAKGVYLTPRGKADAKKKDYHSDSNIPIEATVAAGRLERAVRIFGDLRDVL